MNELEIEQYRERELLNDPYAERHWIANQRNVVEGIIIDPVQRYYFDMTANEERPELETDEWWDVPYIQTSPFTNDSYKEYLMRMGDRDVESEEVFDTRKKAEMKKWCDTYKEGVSYTVRCLNGGAWDRSLTLGWFNNLEDALVCAKAYKNGEYKRENFPRNEVRK